MEKQFIVYKHTSPDGKSYIGMTSKTLEERSKKGNGYYQNKEFYDDIQKIGWQNFQHEVIELGLSEEEARHLEQYYIAMWDTTNPEHGYNQTKGGEKPAFLGKHPSEESRKKMSKTRKGKQLTEEHKHKISEALSGENNPNYGKQLTEEHKHKISEALQGKQLTEERKHKISEALSGENNPMFGKNHTEEAKRKNSESNKGKHAGEKNPMFGKNHTEKTKTKMSEAKQGENNPFYDKHWYNNGDTELRAFECPAGFTPGRLKRA